MNGIGLIGGDGLPRRNLAADVEHQPVSRLHPGGQLDQTAVIASDRDIVESDLAVDIDLGDLRACGDEISMRRRALRPIPAAATGKRH